MCRKGHNNNGAHLREGNLRLAATNVRFWTQGKAPLDHERGIFILDRKRDVIFQDHFLTKEWAGNCIGFSDIEHASPSLPTIICLVEAANKGDLIATSTKYGGIAYFVQDQ